MKEQRHTHNPKEVEEREKGGFLLTGDYWALHQRLRLTSSRTPQRMWMEPNKNSLGLAIRAQCSQKIEWFIQTFAICLFLRYMNYAYLFAFRISKGDWAVSPSWFQPRPPGSSSRVSDMCLGMEGSSSKRVCSTCPICAVIP